MPGWRCTRRRETGEPCPAAGYARGFDAAQVDALTHLAAMHDLPEVLLPEQLRPLAAPVAPIPGPKEV